MFNGGPMGPPLNMESQWFSPHVAYTMAKYGMSMCTLGMSEELKSSGIAVNSLWPRTMIDTAAVNNILAASMDDQGKSKCIYFCPGHPLMPLKYC